MDETVSFGAWLKRRRRELDLTQGELGGLVGCSAITIRKIEADEYRPSKQITLRLAEAVGIPANQYDAFITFARAGGQAPSRSEGELSGSTPWLRPPSSPTPTNLPAQLTSFIGREQILAQVSAFLVRDGLRLVTLTGPPGVGKTRLAIEVATGSLAHFEHGVFFVALGPVNDPALVVSAIAQALGVKEAGGKVLSERLYIHLKEKQVLLVLDNFEHVMAAAPSIQGLLASCARLSVLATSREALHLLGEQQFPVPPLESPSFARPQSLESLSRNPSVALFVERARLVRPAFALTEENAETVAAFCAQLDGLPLAIEIAAARIKVLSGSTTLSSLGSRLNLPISSSRPQGGHQTLRTTIDWSYNLLDAAEQRLFARLGVFTGGCTLAAVEAVCNARGDLLLETSGGVESLLDKSLLGQEERWDQEPRFYMLETIREYALEILAARSKEAPTIRRNHAEYYLALAEAAESELRGAQQTVWLNRLEREHDNLRTALRWAQDNDASAGLRLVVALWRFWWLRGFLSEGRGWLKSMLSLDAVEANITWRAKALRGAGWLAYAQGDYAPARTLFEQGLALFEKLNDRLGIANSLDNLGAVAFTLDDDISASSLYEKSLQIRKAVGDPHAVATSLNNLGLATISRGDYVPARTLLEESLAIYRQLGDGYGIATSLNNLALAATVEGNYSLSRPLLEESLTIRTGMRDKYAIAYSLAGFAALYGRQAGEDEDPARRVRATRLLGATDALLELIGARLENVYLREYYLVLASSHAHLTAEDFAAAWEEGRTMSLEQAVAYALE
jgi:predicted ATPase/transcriptional regulator with XRE-family HTH domain